MSESKWSQRDRIVVSGFAGVIGKAIIATGKARVLKAGDVALFRTPAREAKDDIPAFTPPDQITLTVAYAGVQMELVIRPLSGAAVVEAPKPQVKVDSVSEEVKQATSQLSRADGEFLMKEMAKARAAGMSEEAAEAHAQHLLARKNAPEVEKKPAGKKSASRKTRAKKEKQGAVGTGPSPAPETTPLTGDSEEEKKK